MRIAVLLAVVVSTASLAACGDSHQHLDATQLGLPQSGAPHALATTTINTTPDGGIYENPDHVEVMLVGRHDVSMVEALLGGTASSWSQLSRFGPFTLVALTLRNDGKAGSDPQLNNLQLASDYAPAGTSSGPLRVFYHPTWPLALLSPTAPGDNCSVHIDPGHTAVAILVYPPDDIPRSVVWGAYHSFVLTIPTGGALPALSSLDVAACSPPGPSSTPPS